MLNNKYSPWPSFDEKEIAIVSEVLRSNKVNYWTGTKGKEFEASFAKWCEADYGVAITNGTIALEVALRAVGVEPGDEVIVPPRTFMATASSVMILGAIPKFADIDPISQNICPRSISKNITQKTKAIICVHLAGWPCEMDEIKKICEANEIKIIEDCAQAHGAKYKGRSVGSLGDIAAWSFCQDKIMSTGGEGGMITTNSEDLYKSVWEFKDHGKSYDAVFHQEHPPGFRWLHDSIGSNYRMTEMQAAIGLYQLTKVQEWVERRRVIAKKYSQVINQYEFVRDHSPGNDIYHSYYRYYAFWSHETVTRDDFINLCSQHEIPVFQGSCSEVYLEKAFLNTEAKPQKALKEAQNLGKSSLMFLTHPTLSDNEIDEICINLHQILQQISS
ncbi:DegT/DnrJ/EryC1/StrS aminotransferase family protein [Emcibacteraceae bacterium]|nr:DegT/DnrJ/EryC1/StrS aminotransferase family protein [Emcibacteraceae bacterium]